MGIVVGGGIYTEGDSVRLTAMPAEGYRFDSWQDGDTNNPRTIAVLGDATYTANFVSNVGIYDVQATSIMVSPNPATEAVTVSGLKAGTLVKLIDMAGKECFAATTKGEKLTLDLSTLPAGLYFLRAVSDEGQTTLKIVKQ